MKKIIPVIFLSLMLSACGHDENIAWTPTYELPAAEVVEVEDAFVLNYPTGSNVAYLQEEASLKSLLGDIREDQVSAMTIVMPEKQNAKGKYMKSIVQDTNLKGKKIKFECDPKLHDQTVLKVTHVKAFVPNCPDWSKPNGTDYSNSYGPNFGCATESNLAAMVSNPNDIKGGRTMSPADSHQGVLATHRYRSGEIIDLRREDGVIDD